MYLLQLRSHEGSLQPCASLMAAQERRRIPAADGQVHLQRKGDVITPLEAVRQATQHSSDVHALHGMSHGFNLPK